MKPVDDSFWTIDELGERVSAALAVGYDGVASGRVRDVPDLRTIRYYTTLGLLDRPAEMRGRTALYGRRHLLQLVAIKRLQARGLTLAEIQKQVVGQTDTALARIAEPAQPEPVRPPGRAASFWREPPPILGAKPAARGRGGGEPVNVGNDRTASRVKLGDGAELALTTRRTIDDEDLRVIRMAAAPMIELLRLRGLIGPAEEGGTR